MKLISVAGPSGVGKSTISLMLKCLLEKSYIFCGDNYHKYVRSSPIWASKTHFDPECNDLDVIEKDLNELISTGNSFIRHYNHDTGVFDDLDRVTISPDTTIIYEGLHSFYLKDVTPDLKIYVDTDDNLTSEWKIRRDCAKRGYTEDQVRDTISKRKPDEFRYIKPQRNSADIVIKFEQCRDCIDISYIPSTSTGEDDRVKELMSKLVHLYRSMTDYIKYSRRVASNVNLVQNSGGNLSYKISDDLMIIKSSGSCMNDCSLFDGYSICKISRRYYREEQEYDDELECVAKYCNPSMEYGFHANLEYPVVLHVHPLNLLSILCSQESRTIFFENFKNTSVNGPLIEYATPGYELTNRILDENKNTPIYYLENHGLIVCGNTFQEVIDTASHIEKYSADILDKMCFNKPFIKTISTNGKIYPDHAIFPERNSDYANYILKNMINCGLRPVYLSDEEISKLSQKPSEIYRKAKS